MSRIKATIIVNIIISLSFSLSVYAEKPSILKSEHLKYGAPNYVPNNPRTQLINREGYSLLFDKAKKTPLWVSYRLKKDYTIARTRRPKSKAFKPDPLIPIKFQADRSDYRRSGWDRGHLAPAGDMKRSRQIALETFYFSNIIPQNHNMNSGAWAKLEHLGHMYAKKYHDITIITGPIYRMPLPDGSRHSSIGKNRIGIPNWLYKIFIRKDDAGKHYALAFIMPNQPIRKNTKLNQYIVSINKLENWTKLKFLNALPTSLQSKMKSTKPATLWPFKIKKGPKKPFVPRITPKRFSQ